MEEFTGINCSYCPDAHRIAASLASARPGRVLPIAIHAGRYAAAYTTTHGTALLNNWASQVSGYPCGMVNRTEFGTKTILNRNAWSSSVSSILRDTSCVNVAARCTLDCETRMLTVEVEAYYTKASSHNENFLNIALLQDNILGPQLGMSQNPSQIVGTQYNHMHMFRGFVGTGQWGDTIHNTAKGDFFTKTYQMQLPTEISSTYVNVNDLHIVAFICQGKDTVLTGCGADVNFVNPVPFISSLKELELFSSCDIEFETAVTLTNITSDTIRSVEIIYGRSGTTPLSYIRNGLQILPGNSDTIHLPIISGGGMISGREYTIFADLLTCNGDTIRSMGEQTLSVSKTKVNATGNLTFTLNTDAYGSETSWKFMKTDGTVIASGGPYSNLSSIGTAEHVININIPSNGCYYFEIYDSGSDGINSSSYGMGNFNFVDATGNTVVSNNGRFGDMARYFFNITGLQGIEEGSETEFSIYPNPAKDFVTVSSDDAIYQIDVIDLQGRVLASHTSSTIPVANLAQGTYLLRITTGNGVSIRKIVKE